MYLKQNLLIRLCVGFVVEEQQHVPLNSHVARLPEPVRHDLLLQRIPKHQLPTVAGKWSGKRVQRLRVVLVVQRRFVLTATLNN